MLPRGLNPLTGGAGTPKPNIRKRARIQSPKWPLHLARSHSSIMYVAWSPGPAAVRVTASGVHGGEPGHQ
ncbi:hypothetical protein NDU88_001752 [Pleurodeles waltl]|uniref:Uncharacterized protein n=1 Tax=Pleurodeles waltl TaxID=8319 RepID=A0AAV7LMF6_PLEWA|nr:hypothetical protein NDU88_001752 [Pleurodeles waltl]